MVPLLPVLLVLAQDAVSPVAVPPRAEPPRAEPPRDEAHAAWWRGERLPEHLEYERDVRPILAQKCTWCHGANDDAREADLRLDTREGLFGDLGGYAAVVPKNASESEVWLRVTNADDPMPPAGVPPLAEEELDVVRRWIDAGAPFAESAAFAPFDRPAPPELDPALGARNELDRFLMAAHTVAGLRLAPEADPATLVRRLFVETTGAPPAPELVDAYLAEPSEAAWERLVEAALASPGAAERVAAAWLELAGPRQPGDEAYRAFVRRAMDERTPADRFLRTQLAGDLIAPADPSALAATGFLALGPMPSPSASASDRAEATAAQIERLGATLLGVRLACARCHDDPRDPIRQRDWTALAATLSTARRVERELGGGGDGGPALALGVADAKGVEAAAHVLRGGDPTAPGERVGPGFPAALSRYGDDWPRWLGFEDDPRPPRAGLARWLTDAEGGAGLFAARALANRVWALHFGAPLAHPTDVAAEPPSHPELLDWLAHELVASGWRIDHLRRLILESRVWRSASGATGEAARVDPANRLLARRAVRTLDPSETRAALLAAAGREAEPVAQDPADEEPDEAALAALARALAAPLAERAIDAAGYDPAERVRALWRLAHGRPPTAAQWKEHTLALVDRTSELAAADAATPRSAHARSALVELAERTLASDELRRIE